MSAASTRGPAPREAALEIDIGPASDFAAEGPYAREASGHDLVVLGGDAPRAFEGRCPHQGALLGEGELDGDVLVCRNHRWRFDTTTGCRVGGPQKLTPCPARVAGGRVHVDVSALTRREAAARVESASARRVEDLPGPRPLPLLGNALQLDTARLHTVFEGFAREYGDLFVVHLGPRPILIVGDLDLIEEVLRGRPDTYRRIDVVESVFRELGVSGVFSAEGAEWRPQRRLAMEALSHKHLRGFYPKLQEVTERLLRRWARAADAREEVDIVDDLKRFTVDVTTPLTFGYDVNTLEAEGEVIQEHLGHVFPGFNRRLNAVIPYWRFMKLPADRRLDAALAAIRAWIGERITEARARVEADPSRADAPRDFLEAMLSARDADGEPFSDEVLYGNAMTMLLAGEDTTANTLAWAAHELARHADVARRLREEADAVLGDAAVAPDVETTRRLEYAGAVANETMRVRPVAPLLFHEAVTDTTLGGVSLPKGSALCLLTRLPALRDDAFADARAFRPSRWLSRAEGGAHDASAHLPFGSGPRICPGRSLALLEMRVVLASLAKHFDIERVGADVVWERFSFTMEPARLRVKLRRRARSAGVERAHA